MQILMPYSEHSVVPVIKISQGLIADFECPHAYLKIYRKSQLPFTTQKR